jgi:hypothetical protein
MLILGSLAVIYLFHSLIEFLKTTYTPKRSKDILGIQHQKYSELVDQVIQTRSQEPTETQNFNEPRQNDMKTELDELVDATLLQ